MNIVSEKLYTWRNIKYKYIYWSRGSNWLLSIKHITSQINAICHYLSKGKEKNVVGKVKANFCSYTFADTRDFRGII